MKVKNKIPNPNAIITPAEELFLQGGKADNVIADNVIKDKRCKPRTITMHEDVWDELNSFLSKNPAEGSRSAFITRAVSDLIRRRKLEVNTTH